MALITSTVGLRQRYQPESNALRDRQAGERADLARQQDQLFARFFAIADVSGRTRRRREAARIALSVRHRAERQALARTIQEARRVQLAAVQGRYQPELEDLRHERAQVLALLRERHAAALAGEDELLQAREAAREQARAAMQEQIDGWKRARAPRPAQKARPSPALARSWTKQTAGLQAERSPAPGGLTPQQAEARKHRRARGLEP